MFRETIHNVLRDYPISINSNGVKVVLAQALNHDTK